MITGDLVKCNDTGSLGIVTRVSELPLSTPGLYAVDYKILWPDGGLSWENTNTVTPVGDACYAP